MVTVPNNSLATLLVFVFQSKYYTFFCSFSYDAETSLANACFDLNKQSVQTTDDKAFIFANILVLN